MKLLLLASALCCLPAWLAAQTVWRCGPEGRSFSDTPCTEGRALALPETRPAGDVAAAQARAGREIREAERLRRDRLAAEAAQRGNGLAAVGPVTPAAPAAARSAARLKRQQTEALAQDGALRAARPAARGTSRAAAPSSRQRTD